MDFVSRITDCLSSKLGLTVAPGWQALGALILLSTGGFYVVNKAVMILRVVLSLFILPGKPVCIPWISIIDYMYMLILLYSSALSAPKVAGP